MDKGHNLEERSKVLQDHVIDLGIISLLTEVIKDRISSA